MLTGMQYGELRPIPWLLAMQIPMRMVMDKERMGMVFTGVAAGTDLTDAVNVAQLQAAVAQFRGGESGTSGDGVHYYSVLSNETGPDSNYDNKGAKGKNSLAAGVRASTTENAENAVAIGYGDMAEGNGATVIGQYAKATGDYAMAFGGKHYYDKKRTDMLP